MRSGTTGRPNSIEQDVSARRPLVTEAMIDLQGQIDVTVDGCLAITPITSPWSTLSSLHTSALVTSLTLWPGSIS